jgi:hypothetical protein
VRSWELLPGVFGRLAERKVEDGAEWFRSSLRECFGREEAEEKLRSSSLVDPSVDARVGRGGRSGPLRMEEEGREDGSSAVGESRRGD